MSTSVKTDIDIVVADLLTTGLDGFGPTTQTFNHTFEFLKKKLTGSTAPAVTKAWSDEITLSAGAATIDLTNLTYINIESGGAITIDMTGLRLQLLVAQVDSANTGDVTIKRGATNGLTALEAAGGGINLGEPDTDLNPFIIWFAGDAGADIGASEKDIDLSSSDVDAKIKVLIVCG